MLKTIYILSLSNKTDKTPAKQKDTCHACHEDDIHSTTTLDNTVCSTPKPAFTV